MGGAESTACAGKPEHSAFDPTSGGPAPPFVSGFALGHGTCDAAPPWLGQMPVRLDRLDPVFLNASTPPDHRSESLEVDRLDPVRRTRSRRDRLQHGPSGDVGPLHSHPVLGLIDLRWQFKPLPLDRCVSVPEGRYVVVEPTAGHTRNCREDGVRDKPDVSGEPTHALQQHPREVVVDVDVVASHG